MTDPSATNGIAEALARVTRQAATPTSENPERGFRALRPRTVPGPAARPHTRRAIYSVATDLFAVFQDLVAGRRPWPLYLWGSPGTGKTSAALALLDQCGPAPLAGAWPDVVRDWYAGFVEVRHLAQLRIGADQGRYQWSRDGLSGDVTWDALVRGLKRAPLFVFDEIGVGREASDFKLDLLLDVLGARCDDPVRPFIVTSNRAPADIENVVYDARVASRILCGTVYELSGTDRRFAS